MTAALNESEHSYVFDPENASEIARLLVRDEFLKKAMEGPFPERTNLDGITRILDIGCGTGGWALDVASSYPSTEVTGIDISETMLTRARDEAQKLQLKNVTFQKMDALKPLQFPSHYFDLVNMRAAVEYVPREKWPAVLQECYRVTQPDGTLRLTEADRLAHTNSSAFEQYNSLYAHMLYLRGHGFSPDGQTLGMTPMLGNLLRDAGYQHTYMKSCVLDISYNTIFQTGYRRLLEIHFVEVQPQLIERKLATPSELEDIYNELLYDIAQETFCGVAYPLIFWGEK